MGKPRHRRPLAFEALERRETPSAMLGGAHAIHEAATRSVAIRGSGTATLTGEKTLSNGEIQATANLSGRATPLGGFSGTLTSTLSVHQTHVDATGVLVASNGDLDIAFSGNYRAPRHNATRTSGTFSFRITGGTGAFSHLTGGGTVRGTVSLVTGTLNFTINGRARE